ncbi:aminotransferase [Salsuginibacillus halophilus]|uniref:Aminotransferase n=1 Tax=Salsuginibacillus halophilus TaxID=517424 RepID=A0A2P8HW08_9BACI|nr:aminotransferase class I/II-fold pyridoxal phosphate-dependent enzyme [Salsuginibacillus halophilus]PSL50422.1 aminotransferase [Salsuginibacillus halophilus]
MEFKRAERIERLPEQFFASLVKKAAKKQQETGDVINLGQGNPDQPTPERIVQALQNAADKPEHHRYASFRGLPDLKEAVSRYYEEKHGVHIDPKTEVAVTFGAKAGIIELSQCLLNEGDGALLPDPGYPDYLSGIALAGGVMHSLPLDQNNNFQPAFHELSHEAAKKSRMLFMNYPNNPTGAVVRPETFEAAVNFAKTHELCVVHDFAYGAIGFDGHQPPSFLETPDAKESGVELLTLSKTYNMAGWRVGFVVGNASVVEAVNVYQDHMHCSLFGAVQEAAAEALQGPDEEIAALRALYERRRDVFMNALHDAGWQVTAPEGSFFAWLKLPEGWTSEAFADKVLKEAGVVFAPGRGFGEGGEGYVRAALLAPEVDLKEAARRLKALQLW